MKIQKKLDDFVLDKEWEVRKGEVISLFGPSGSGKSLSLQAIAGLVTPDDGYIEINEQLIFHKERKICVPSRDRGIGYVPQNYGLFPHMKIDENIMFGMVEKDKNIKEEKMMKLLSCVGLENKRNKYPQHLSGGEKQRVAIVRALATNPKVLLLDEPFSAVDIPIRKILRNEIKEFLTRWNMPVVLVTHDPEDVEVLATEVVDYC
ncbi:ATP-binding cassette domain-containing protein [Natronincola ferrireducens]|uniref:Molybdate transport system ATP-binding protein n=1 Tax=Natronincola ferrireducens TaxID=393762 RepID=A0A1G8ZPY3_9FIRM|nr:ATP-binding cassette domain-containing protein [Natronincola ferrireducens]SDK17107.1 molybdate transport system ATP-binding protein [Natronincola ferrireducens]